MRYVRLSVVAVVLVAMALALRPTDTQAAFHCMRIHAVMAGLNGDDTIQYVELRMNLATQNVLAGHTIKFFDNTATLKATFTFPDVPALPEVPNALTGDSILIGTSEFNTATVGGDADFTFDAVNTVGANGGDSLHPIQGPEGRVIFADGNDNCDANFMVTPGEVDSLTYNDQSGGDSGAQWGTPAVPLPGPSDTRALRINNLANEPSNNSTEYALEFVSNNTFTVSTGDLATDFTTPRNNSRTVLALAPAVGGVGQLPDVIGTDGGSGVSWLIVAVAAAGAFVALGGGVYAWRRVRA